MLRPRRAVCGLALLALLCTPAAAQRATADDLARAAGWLAGEWDNNEQVWQQKIDAADPKVAVKPAPVDHLHDIFAPIAAPQLGTNIFYVQRSNGDDLKALRSQRVLRLVLDEAAGAVRIDSFALRDAPRHVGLHARPQAWASLSAAELLLQQGCEVTLKFDTAEQVFAGTTRPGSCPAGLPVSWRLSAGQLQLGEPAGDAVLRSRKVQYYEGWVWFRIAGPGSSPEDKKTSFTAKYLLHNEGQRMVVNLDDGTPSPYLLELALLTYQNTRRPVLKFALLDRQTLKTLSYVWTAVGSPTIGMNLGWFQAGVTQKAERTSFGF